MLISIESLEIYSMMFRIRVRVSVWKKNIFCMCYKFSKFFFDFFWKIITHVIVSIFTKKLESIEFIYSSLHHESFRWKQWVVISKNECWKKFLYEKMVDSIRFFVNEKVFAKKILYDFQKKKMISHTKYRWYMWCEWWKWYLMCVFVVCCESGVWGLSIGGAGPV